jgi:hypothetical protein
VISEPNQSVIVLPPHVLVPLDHAILVASLLELRGELSDFADEVAPPRVRVRHFDLNLTDVTGLVLDPRGVPISEVIQGDTV